MCDVCAICARFVRAMCAICGLAVNERSGWDDSEPSAFWRSRYFWDLVFVVSVRVVFFRLKGRVPEGSVPEAP